MTQCIISRFSRLLVITAVVKQVLTSAFKIKSVLLWSCGGRFVLVTLNVMRIKGSTTASAEESLLAVDGLKPQ